MAIKSSIFGRLELSGKDAARFIRHMNEDKPNEKVKLALERGRKLLEMVNARRSILRKIEKSDHPVMFIDLNNYQAVKNFAN